LNLKFFIVMGVSGSGKTSVGKALAAKLGWDFFDADDFHPPDNITKMARGLPLSDDDRAP
jgi:gluconokinase